MSIEDVKQKIHCPHCKSNEGYFFKTKVTGTCESRFTFNDEFLEEDNQDMHNHLEYQYSKYAYCRSCGKRLFKSGS